MLTFGKYQIEISNDFGLNRQKGVKLEIYKKIGVKIQVQKSYFGICKTLHQNESLM